MRNSPPGQEIHARAREIHAGNPAIDGHADSLWRYLAEPEGFFGDKRLGHLDSRRLRETGQNVQVMAIYTPPEQVDLAALQYALDFLYAINAALDSPSNAGLRPPYRRILSPDDLREACRPGSFGILIFIEGASPFRGNMKNLDLFHRLGVRGITITHNHDNEAARGCFADGDGRGLTDFGRAMVREMNRRGIVIDLAHSNEEVFWDALSLSRKPVIDSHTGLRAFWDHPRNLRDAQLDGIRENGGVVCIDYLPDHLVSRPEPKPRVGIDQVVRVIEHAVARTGIDHVGLGADWDGFEETVEGLEDCAQLPRLTEALLGAGFTEADVAKVLGGNMLRALSAAMAPGGEA
jgi:membrane dipeptidase